MSKLTRAGKQGNSRETGYCAPGGEAQGPRNRAASLFDGAAWRCSTLGSSKRHWKQQVVAAFAEATRKALRSSAGTRVRTYGLLDLGFEELTPVAIRTATSVALILRG